jgi:hypothetical protein
MIQNNSVETKKYNRQNNFANKPRGELYENKCFNTTKYNINLKSPIMQRRAKLKRTIEERRLSLMHLSE